MTNRTSTTKANTPTSFRLSNLSSYQLEQLVEATGLTRTEIVMLALDRMYRQEEHIVEQRPSSKTPITDTPHSSVQEDG